METQKILTADVLDIIFDGRNKEYGAYDLRKSYNRRLLKSLFVTGTVILLLCSGYFISNLHGQTKKVALITDDWTLLRIATPEKKQELPPVAPRVKPAAQPKMETRAFTTPPQLVKDPPEDQKPPEQADLDDTRIGTANQVGVKDEGIAPGPIGDGGGKGLVETPKSDGGDEGFVPVEVESTYPGGAAAWLRFLNKTFRYPDEAMSIEAQGVVVVQFIVDKDGNVSDAQAISGPEKGGLREEAVRVIKKSGKWTPALQNGRFVKSYKKQPIIFRIDE